MKKLDKDLFLNTLEFTLTSAISAQVVRSPDDYADWLIRAIQDATDVAAPRARFDGRGNKRMYWWSEEISDLRRASLNARRCLTHARRRADPAGVATLWADYRNARASLRRVIKHAKGRSWGELLAAIDRGPWGLPYKLVMNKLRKSVSSLTDRLDRGQLLGLVDSLFPAPRVLEEP